MSRFLFLLVQDIDSQRDTLVIYAFREGEGIGQHPNANRGAATVNFATGNVENECADNEFITLHGALMLIAWMLLAPAGIYYARCGRECAPFVLCVSVVGR